MTASITKIFRVEEIQALMDKCETLRMEIVVPETMERVWSVISDNDLVRRKMKMTLVDFTYQPIEEGGSMLEGEFKTPFGRNHFFELPFEWVAGHYSYGARLYDVGSIQYASVGFYLTSEANGDTRITGVMKVIMRGPLRRFFLRKMQKTVSHFPEVIKELLQRLESEKPQPFEASLRKKPDPERLKRYEQGLRKLAPFHPQIAALADYAARASRRYLQRLRPYAIADFYQLPRQETLSFFLEGTQVGLFSLNWDILCPACRGTKRQSKSLRDLEPKVHCEACGINFDVIDSKDVELTFAFAGELTAEPEPIYCIGNPARNPAIHVQMPVAPGESRQMSLELSGRTYRLRDMKQGHLLRVQVDPNGVSEVNQALIASHQKDNRPLLVQSQFTLHWQNTGELWQVLRLDCLDPNLNAATADEVASLPNYQHLFADDALRPGMQLGVGHLVFLFSDIRGSTQLYKELGDSKAFRLVQDHFSVMDQLIKKAGGTIVKTIGDAVMASFVGEIAAIGAALAIQRHYDAQKSGRKLPGLKIALHSGPCIMVNLNDRMDYFGTTVNACSRLLDLAGEEDLLVSETLFNQLKVQEFLRSQDVTWSQEQQVLRGLEHSQTFYRLKLIRHMPTRLIS